MALRVLRLVVPSGATAFKAASVAQKVRAEKNRSRIFIRPAKPFKFTRTGANVASRPPAGLFIMSLTAEIQVV